MVELLNGGKERIKIHQDDGIPVPRAQIVGMQGVFTHKVSVSGFFRRDTRAGLLAKPENRVFVAE